MNTPIQNGTISVVFTSIVYIDITYRSRSLTLTEVRHNGYLRTVGAELLLDFNFKYGKRIQLLVT